MRMESKCNSCNNKNIKCDVCNATSDIYNHHPCYQPKPKTNFEEITSSVEVLAEFIETISVKEISKKRIIEWLQKECNEE